MLVPLQRPTARPAGTKRWLAGCFAWLFSLSVTAGAPPADQVREALDAGHLRETIIEARTALQTAPADHAVRAMLVEALLRLGAGSLAQETILEGQAQGWPPDGWVKLLGRAYLQQGKFDDLVKAMRFAGAATPGGKADALSQTALAQVMLGDKDTAKATFQEALGVDPGNIEAELGMARLAIADKDYPAAEAALAPARAAAPKDPEVWTVDAALHLAQAEPDAAIESYSNALAHAAGSVQTLLARAALYVMANQPDKARADLDTVEALVAKHPQAVFLRATLDYQRGDFSAARDRAEAVLNVMPTHDRALLLAGVAHLRLGELAQAEERLDKAMGASTGNPAPVQAMAALRLRQQRYADAIRLLEPLHEHAPDDPGILTELGGAYLRTGEPEIGLSYLERAVALAPSVPGLKLRLAWGQMLAGQPGTAIELLQSGGGFAEDYQGDDFLLLLAEVQSRQFDKALQTAARLHQKLPDNPVPVHLSGVAHQQLGQLDEARKDYSGALQIKPDFVPATLALAKLEAAGGDVKAASERIQRLLAKDPSNVEALLVQAQLSAASGKPEESIRQLEEIRRAHPENLQASLLLARIYAKRGEGERAERLLREMLDKRTNNPVLLDAMVQVLGTEGKLEDAMRYQEQRVALTPDAPEALRRLALLQSRNALPAEAHETLDKALKLEPDDPRLLAAGVDLALAQKRFDEAMGYVTRIQAQQPGSAAGLVLEGDVRLARGEAAEAIGLYRQAFDMSPSRPLVRKLVSAQQRAGKAEQALAVLEDWLAKQPQDLRARETAAQLAQQLGHDDRAVQHYEQVLATKPDAVLALNNLAWLYNEGGNPKALELAERAHRIAPDQAPIADTLGWVLACRGQIERGLELIRQAQRALPDDPTIRYHLAFAFQKAGQPDLARLYLRPLIKADKPFPEAEQAKKLYAEVSGSQGQ